MSIVSVARKPQLEYLNSWDVFVAPLALVFRVRSEISQLSQGDCIAVYKEMCSENQSSNGASTGKKKDCDHFGSRLFQCLPLFKLGNNYRCDIENYYGHSEKCATKLLGKNV